MAPRRYMRQDDAMIDEKYEQIRSDLPTRQTFFDGIRALTRYLYFENWDAMLSFMLQGLKRLHGLEPEILDSS